MEENPQEKSYEREAEYISEESPEISVGEIPYLSKIFTVFPAFRSRNYLLYFSGQLISLIGTWLQTVAQGWLVFQLTNSALLLGVVTAIGSLPMLFLSLYGGVIVDRFPKRKILIFTQTSSMILAFALGILVVLHMINVWEICVLAFLLGVVNAVDSPARQSFVPEMVGKERLSSAIALNSGIFNAARVIGPTIAGFLIVLVGTGGAFILNGISYIAVIIALFAIKVPNFVQRHQLNPVAAIKEGLNFSFGHPVIKNLLILIGIVSVFGWSFTTVLPIIARNIFHLGAAGLGYLYAATGLGALCATILVSATSKKVSPAKYIFGGNFLFAIAIFLFTLNINFILCLIFLFFAGFGLLIQVTTLNSTIQNIVTHELRGRVMSIYVLMFIGTTPIGSFEVGWLSDRFGTSFAIGLGAIIVFIFGTLLLINRKKVLGDLRPAS